MGMRWGAFLHRKTSKPLICSFCGKDSASVKALIAGPGVSICDECVAVCNKCLDGEADASTPAAWDQCSDEMLLEQLGRSSVIADSAGDLLHMHVAELRKRGVQWAAIGKALGVSRQAAWQRFS